MNIKNIVFWNVDTQFDFMNEKGLLYVKGAEEIEPTLQKLTTYAKEHNIKVVNTADYHRDNSEELSNNPDYMSTFPPHCMAKTIGANYVESTSPEHAFIIDWWSEEETEAVVEQALAHRNVIIRKDKFDVFSGNPFTNAIVQALSADTVYVYGVTTNVCVDFAVRGLIERGVKVVAITDAMKELSTLPVPFKEWEKLGVVLDTFEKAFC